MDTTPKQNRLTGDSQQPKDRRVRLSRIRMNPRRKRFLLIFIAVFLLTIGGIVTSAWYLNFYLPPRVESAVVNETKFDQGDLVKRVRMIQAATGYSETNITLTDVLRILYNPDLDVCAGPFNLGMVQLELLIQASDEFNVKITENDIDAFVSTVFEADVPPGQETTQDQLDREFDERYLSYLNFNRITEDEFRRLALEQLTFLEMVGAMDEYISEEIEHVNVSWIRVPLIPDPIASSTDTFEDVTAVRERALIEGFETVAADYSKNFVYALNNGSVGWIPKGAFPDLDPWLFGTEDAPGMDPGQLTEGIQSGDHFVIAKVNDGPKVMEVGARWRSKLREQLLESWVEDRFEKGTSEGWVAINFDSSLYEWTVEQLMQTAGQKRGISLGE